MRWGVGLRLRAVDLREAAGLRLGQSLLDERGRVLLAAGVRLTAGLCEVLLRRGYMQVYAADGVADDVAPQDALSPATRARAVAAARECYTRLAKGADLPLRQVMAAVDAVLDDLRTAPAVALEFDALRSVSAYTYVHSVNVCVYSLMIGQAQGLRPQDLRVLGAGALLHDVGKVLCADLCEKPGPLDEVEWARMRQHPIDGFEMLRHHHELHLFAAHIAYQHHERLDGSGYPRGLTGERILPWARLVAVADVFDAMTADRAYARARPRSEAMAELQRGAGLHYEAEVVRLFQRRMALYPSGTPVLLADGSVAVVVAQTEDPGQPLVRILGRAGRPLDMPEETRAAGDRGLRQVLTRWPPWLQAALDATGTE